MIPGEAYQKIYTSIEPLSLDVDREQLLTSSNGSIMSSATGTVDTTDVLIHFYATICLRFSRSNTFEVRWKYFKCQQ